MLSARAIAINRLVESGGFRRKPGIGAARKCPPAQSTLDSSPNYSKRPQFAKKSQSGKAEAFDSENFSITNNETSERTIEYE
ncbi:hypothetical protein EAI_12363 [Harpegnathos saltator]|uniref:Uncharacterized protein n=1 Tax=Harpegnathos saltator TaxID=610380 RepID=E2BYC9_HARSA|nr:hypothetical protein EAI_12363 [Harpegnathos saltator]